MKPLRHLIVPSLLLFATWGCNKPHHLKGSIEQLPNQPAVLLTSLQDSLPAKALQELKIDKRILGTKIKYNNGRYVSYFEYEADHQTLLRTIGRLPFSRAAILADTTCRAISIDDFNQLRTTISAVEEENTASFWNVASPQVVVYECIKAPFKHTLVLDKTTSRVLHRVAFEG